MGVDVAVGGVAVAEGSASRRGDVSPAHYFLGIGLGGLDAGGAGCGPEAGEAQRRQVVDEPGRERGFGPDHCEIDLVLAHRRRDAPVVAHRNGKVRADQGRAGIAGRTVNGRRASEEPAEGVLAPAAADDQNPHRLVASLKAWENACAARLAASVTLSTVFFASRA